ncbi:MAG: DsrE family protein, partial [Sulfuriferula sp.]
EGVDFKVCNNTLNSRKLTAEAVAYPAKIVPSGVAEIGRLQAKEGYVYLKP